jgi:transcriptional regulator with XRE-family HTH domain
MPWNRVILKTLRERRDWTQDELARRVDAHRVTIAKLETGERQPSVDMLERLAQALEVKVTDFLK